MMTARPRRVPLIFREDEVPLARATDVESVEADRTEPIRLGAATAERAGAGSRGVLPRQATRATEPSNLKSDQPGSEPSEPGVDARAVRGSSGPSPAGPSPLTGSVPLTLREVCESGERVQIGPRIHPIYKAFLEDLYHPIRHQSEGGVQTMLMACLEIVRRDPALQQRAQQWAAEATLEDD